MLARPKGVGTWTYLALEFDSAAHFGTRAQVKVRGTLSGTPFRSTLLPRGDGTHYLVVPRPLREQLGVTAGDRVEVVLAPDVGTRLIPIPADFRAALRRTKGATAAFNAMSPSHRREYVEAIEEAKRPETRARRIANSIAMLMRGQRRRSR